MPKLAFFLLLTLFGTCCMAQEETQGSAMSPKPAWGDFEVKEENTAKPWYAQVLLWPVNRVLDLVDIVRLDAGVGVSTGGVIRVTKYGQMGYRTMHPGSLRIGAFGRKAPGMVETSNEFGIGPGYISSKDRVICSAEIGVGADLVVPALYGGLCLNELFDFVGGIFFLDPSDDDIR